MKDELPRLPSEAYIKGREDASKKLRDEFAGLAMQGLLSREPNGRKSIDYAKASYRVADAMMEARK